MGISAEIPTVWNQLAETMYLKDSPTAEVRLSDVASFSFGRVQNKTGLPEIAQPIFGESGHIIALQLKPIPFIGQFLGKKKVSSGSYPVGAVSAIDLQDEPSCLLPNPFDAFGAIPHSSRSGRGCLCPPGAPSGAIGLATRGLRSRRPSPRADPPCLPGAIRPHLKDIPGPHPACLELSFC